MIFSYNAKVFIRNNPYAISMILQRKGSRKSEKLWDMNSFRPDPRSYLKKNTLYNGVIDFSIENLEDGSEIMIPQKIRLNNGYRFINIR